MAGLFSGFHAAEHRAPDRVSGLVLAELEGRIDVQSLPEFFAARLHPAGNAVDESEKFVGPRLFGSAAQTRVEARLQQSCRVGILAVLVGLDAEFKFFSPRARKHPGEVLSERCASGKRQAREHRRKPAVTGHRPRNLCRMLISAPDLTSTVSMWDGNDEFLNSTRCLPGLIGIERSGGLTPCLVPSSETPAPGRATIWITAWREQAGGAATSGAGHR